MAKTFTLRLEDDLLAAIDQWRSDRVYVDMNRSAVIRYAIRYLLANEGYLPEPAPTSGDRTESAPRSPVVETK